MTVKTNHIKVPILSLMAEVGIGDVVNKKRKPGSTYKASSAP